MIPRKIIYGTPSQVYGVGRVCAYPGCTAILSRYNPENVCGCHPRKYKISAPRSKRKQQEQEELVYEIDMA
jgi:hypothetical protein